MNFSRQRLPLSFLRQAASITGVAAMVLAARAEVRLPGLFSDHISTDPALKKRLDVFDTAVGQLGKTFCDQYSASLRHWLKDPAKKPPAPSGLSVHRTSLFNRAGLPAAPFQREINAPLTSR